MFFPFGVWDAVYLITSDDHIKVDKFWNVRELSKKNQACWK